MYLLRLRFLMNVMNVLILGDGHVYGRGLSAGRLSYIAQFIRLVSKTGRTVSVDAYVHLTITQTLATLAYLPLNRYDLIIVQPGDDWFGHPVLSRPPLADTLPANGAGFSPLPLLNQPVKWVESAVRPNRENRQKLLFKYLFTNTLTAFGRGKSSPQLLKLLAGLRPYRHNVLLLTPLPHRDPVCQLLRMQSRSLLFREGNKQLFSVFDSNVVIRPREEYFLPNSDSYLNAISHELLGRALFDFYQSAPTIVTVQAIKPD